MIKTESIYKLN